MFAKLKEAAKTAAKEVGTVAEKAAKDIVDSEQTQKVLRDLSEKTQQAKDIVESEQTQKVFRDLSKKTQHLTTELQQHQAAATKLTWRWNTTQLKMGCMSYSFADMPAGV